MIHKISNFTTLLAINKKIRLENKYLKQTKQNFEKIFLLCPSALCLSSQNEGRFLEVNESFCQLLEYTRQEIIGKTSVEIGIFKNYQERKNFFNFDMSNFNSEKHEFKLTTKSGKEIFILLSLKILEYEDNQCYLCCFKDVTKYKKQEGKLQEDNQVLRCLVHLDGLTQIANRRHFDKYIQQEWWRMLRQKLPLSLIICDIDYFKRYNDNYGLQSGDYCIKQVAEAIQNSVGRASDLVARYGGEEFVVVLPDTCIEGAYSVAKKIRLELQQAKLVHPNSDVSPYVTLSMGISSLIPTSDLTISDLIALANKALSQAKNQGRDCIVKSKPD